MQYLLSFLPVICTDLEFHFQLPLSEDLCYLFCYRLRLVVYKFFSCSTNIPRGLSPYKPQKLVVYCLNKRRVPGDISACPFFLFLIIGWLFLFLYLFMYFLNFFLVLIYYFVRIRRPPSASSLYRVPFLTPFLYFTTGRVNCR